MSLTYAELLVSALVERQANVSRAVLDGGTVSTTTIGTESAPSIVESPGGAEGAARVTSALPGASK